MRSPAAGHRPLTAATESACRQYRAVRWFLLPEAELRPRQVKSLLQGISNRLLSVSADLQSATCRLCCFSLFSSEHREVEQAGEGQRYGVAEPDAPEPEVEHESEEVAAGYGYQNVGDEGYWKNGPDLLYAPQAVGEANLHAVAELVEDEGEHQGYRQAYDFG